jgi:hypothetical protein
MAIFVLIRSIPNLARWFSTALSLCAILGARSKNLKKNNFELAIVNSQLSAKKVAGNYFFLAEG